MCTERYRQIPILLPKLRFLELQVDLLHEFLQDLISAVEKLFHSPLSAQFISYLNAVNYIDVILREWTEQTVCNCNVHLWWHDNTYTSVSTLPVQLCL